MPSHIYIRTNMWDRSIEQNALAMLADDQYRRRSPDHYIQHMYMVHNNHVLAYSAMMVGREKEAMSASRKMWTAIPGDQLEVIAPWVDRWMCSVYDVQKRFGRWDALLAEPGPPEYMPITSAFWRAHRAIAFAAKKDFASAENELLTFEHIRANLADYQMPPGETVEMVQRRLEAIRHFVPAEIALHQERYPEAIKHLRKSVEAEDKLGFGGEPPDYLQPIRHTLGAVLVQTGDYERAEHVYREDLEEYPGNGWSLYGLSRALHGQGKIEQARSVEEEFRRAWARADEPLTTSCKCIPRI